MGVRLHRGLPAVSAALHFAATGLPGRPARVGDAFAIYLLGTEQTSPPVHTGEAAPCDPLAPFLDGLYQINFIVPEGTLPGDEVWLHLELDGVSSNVLRIAVE
jgi:hypothetical protein